MKEFWFTLAAGAGIAAPIAYAIGRHGLIGCCNAVLDWLDDTYSDDDRLARTIDEHPANVPPARSHVRVIAEGR